ncbi:MAG: NapC/NirT family cytochrome c [Anaerolineales bacterium]|nr:NapC/NirT family cytochrome c [Anaerolineales bacterium]
MKRFLVRLKTFFFPPAGTPRWLRILPYAILGLLTLLLIIAGGAAWEYTNSSAFCGTACHTMPPEYTSYLTSPHARVACVECHLGRGFIAENITRKAGDAKHIISLAFKQYEFPIEAQQLRPARETCEKCHFPEKFSDDSLREIKTYNNDVENSLVSTFLILKTGGGSTRLGLGQGIHWHIENPVYYLASDKDEQEIPYIRYEEKNGSIIEYIDIESDFDPTEINEEDLKVMDCITCHNRITHLVPPPDDMIDQMITNGQIQQSIPEIRRIALEIFSRSYKSSELALNSIAGIEDYYQTYYPEYYTENEIVVQDAITALQQAYSQSVYPEQKSDWNSHANNIGHDFSPGCFRCHDGQHINEENEAVRLECNLCHSIPVVADTSDFVTNIEISRGPEPETHLNANWITLHRDVFDPTCVNCHTTEDPGGMSDTSFCSNSACHGSVWTYAGFNAPKLRAILQEQLPPPYVEPQAPTGGPLTFEDTIGPVLELRCGSCHGKGGIEGLDLTTYESTMAGGDGGQSIVPGDPDNSLLVIKQTGEQAHFGQLTVEELELVTEWIIAGAPETGE